MAPPAGPAVPTGPADLVVVGARAWTGDPARPRAEALAVTGGVLSAVGTREQVWASTGTGTEVLDLGGAAVVPGLVDVHVHHARAGLAELFELTLPPGAGVEAVLAAVREHAAGLGPDDWVVGGSWGSSLMSALDAVAVRRALDEAAGGRAVVLTDDSLHNRWASTRALTLAGVDAASSAPDGGEVRREAATGEPTGVLLEQAGLVVARAAAAARPLSDEQHRAASRRGVEVLSRHGVTAVQDAATPLETLRALAALDTDGALDAWVVSSMPLADPIFGHALVGEDLFAAGAGTRTAHHRPDFVKVFLDGVPPARTAAFLQPYLPDAHGEDFRASTTLDADALVHHLRAAAARGLGAKVHCTGDASVRLVLDAVAVLRAEGVGVRYQVAHGQYVHPDDVPRFAALGVAADVSPFLWVPGEIPDAIATVLPAERAGRMQPVRDLLEAGALVAGGSDWPVSPTPNLWEGVQGLVTRADPGGTHPGTLWPEQAVTLEQALSAFTAGGAAAMGLGEVTGALRAGLSADFVVLDRDPFAGPVTDVAATRAQQTWFAGRKVFGRSG